MLGDLAGDVAVGGAALDRVADGKPKSELPLRDKLRGLDAREEPFLELGVVQVLADEDELGLAFLAGFPRLVEVAVEDHVHRLKHETLLTVCDVQHALHAVQVRALVHQEVVDPPLKRVEVEGLVLDDADGGDGVVVLVLVVGVEELGVHVYRLLQVKGVDVEDQIDGDFGLLGSDDGCGRVDGLEPGGDALHVGFVDEIHLVENHAIGEGDLLDRLVLGALGLLLVQVLLDVFGIHEGDDAVQAKVLLDAVVDEEGLCDGRWVRHSSGLDKDAV